MDYSWFGKFARQTKLNRAMSIAMDNDGNIIEVFHIKPKNEYWINKLDRKISKYYYR